jgi:hypothetical protein
VVASRRKRPTAENETLREVSVAEGRRLFDEEARRALGMSGDEFLRAWDAGEIDPNEPGRHSAIVRVLMLLPFVRPPVQL